MDPNDNMRKRTPLPLQDWLWRLDRIQERLAQLLPERDLHVGLSLEMVQDRITNLGPSEKELSTFPFGVVLDVTSLFVYFRPESDSGIPWLDLRKECLDRWHVTPPQDWFMDLEYKLLKDLLSNPVLARARTWYYYSDARPSDNVRPRDTMRQGDFLSHILDVQDALVETCSLAPDGVVVKFEGDRSAFGCQRTPFGVDTIMAACRDRPPTLWDWLTVLSYMTSHQMHALLKWWVEDLCWYARDPLGEPEFTTINNYWIGLTPDFRTATEYGLDVLRHLATGERKGQSATAATGSNEGTGSPAEAKLRRTKPQRSRKKTGPQLLKETRERQAAREIAADPGITAERLGKLLDCHKSTVTRLEAWKKRGVLHREAPRAEIRDAAPDEDPDNSGEDHE